jgi:RimJ/RimL family protein N-acetyltransferase
VSADPQPQPHPRTDDPSPRRNELGQPIGPDIGSWTPPEPPRVTVLEGRWTRLERLDVARHAPDLWQQYSADEEGRMWTYLPFGPFADEAELTSAVTTLDTERDLRFYAVVDPTDDVALGLMAYLRIDPPAGSIEVGAVMFSPRLQRTRLATEALFLMADHVFTLGYRRFEWKCDALNGPSRRAAERFGFTFEGIFRQATVYKQRSRDTAWFSMLDHEWPDRREGYCAWLAEDNFDPAGQQRRPLDVRPHRTG